MIRLTIVALVLALASTASAQSDDGATAGPTSTEVSPSAPPDGVTSVLSAGPAAPVFEIPEPEPLTSLPTGRGLPVLVRVAVPFIDVTEVDEDEGAFEATIDIRLQWDDPRLAYPVAEAAGGPREYRGDRVEERLAEIWSPAVRLSNQDGEPSYEVRGLWIGPQGHVELMRRVTARFTTRFDVERFPFDHQHLSVQVVAERESSEVLRLDFRQDDLGASRVSSGVDLHGWDVGLVSIHRDLVPGWHGDWHDELRVSLEVVRQAARTAPPIFVPLFASLIIPLLAMWLNRSEDGEFKIEAFELANVVIGGLFAVIALNFTVNAEYGTLASGDNTVARLFGLNYLTLATSLMINVLLFRFNIVQRLFGKDVQEQTFRFISWSVPLLAISTAIAIVLAARA